MPVEEEGGRRKRRRRLNLDEDNVLKAVDVFLDVGRRVHRLSKYRRALQYYDTAVELDPESLKPLEPRAATLTMLAHFTEALQEIAKLEEACKARGVAVPPSAWRLKVEALWQGGHFEQAAVRAARGMQARRQPPYFTDMYYTSLATLDQCIGSSALECLALAAGNEALMDRLRPFDPYFVDEVVPVRRGHYVKPKTKEELCREQRYREFLRSRRVYKAQLLLGAVASDLEFLDGLAEHPALAAGNRASEAGVRHHVASVGHDMTKRMDHMEEECPLYAVRHRAKVRTSPELRRRLEREQRERSERVKEEATRAVLRVLAARTSKDLRLVAQALHSARVFFEGVSLRVLPDRGDYQALLYHLIGVTYMQLGLLGLLRAPDAGEPEARARLRRQHVRVVLQAGETRQAATAGVAIPFFDYAGSLRDNEQRLRRAKSKLERLCLTFEMAHFCSKMHRWEQSLNYARKALAMAREEGHNVWMVLAAVERCKAEMHLKTRIEAKTTIREAIEMAEVLDDEYVLELLHAIAEALESPALLLGGGEDGDEDKDDPQERILRLMGEAALRSRCVAMFARINALPPECRMSLRGRWRDEVDGEAGADAARRKGSASATFFREEDSGGPS